MMYHTSVLLQESIDALEIKANGIYVDATFGGGGHSKEILKKLDTGKLIAFDQDGDAELNNITDEKFLFIRHNFRYMKNFLKYYGYNHIDGLIADLGVSSHHFDQAERGFSFRFDAPLDMRMNQDKTITAKDILNTYSQDQLNFILGHYGEVDKPGKISAAIIKYRNSKKLENVQDLVNAISSFIPAKQEHKFLATVFQAIRIELNEEIECLKELLIQTIDLLNVGGRMVIISYHSLEDKLVKNFFRSGNLDGNIEKDFFGNIISPVKPLSNKVIIPGDEELTINNRARSAKMRIGVKI